MFHHPVTPSTPISRASMPMTLCERSPASRGNTPRHARPQRARPSSPTLCTHNTPRAHDRRA